MEEKLSSCDDVRCLNLICDARLSRGWKSGWRLRSGLTAKLCNFCGSLFHKDRFCRTFHLDQTGWCPCKACKKLFHCGCVASIHLFVLSERGGIECLGCVSEREKTLDQTVTLNESLEKLRVAKSGEKKGGLEEERRSAQRNFDGDEAGKMVISDVFASTKGKENGSGSAPGTKKHPRHKPTCECVVCIQPPSGYKHEAGCSCYVCEILKRRRETQQKKRLQSEGEPAAVKPPSAKKKK